MQKLKADANGFLVGDAVEITDLLGTWGQMRSDLRAIRHALESGGVQLKGAGRDSSNKSAKVQAAMPAQNKRRPGGGNGISSASGKAAAAQRPQARRTLSGKDAAKVAQVLGGAGAASGTKAPAAGATQGRAAGVQEAAQKAAQLAMAKRGAKDAAAQAQRDGRGRFTRGGSRAGSSESGAGDEGDFEGLGSVNLGAAVDKLSKGLDGLGNAEQVDPSVKAFNEVAKPVTRGLQGLGILGDGESRQERNKNRWYRRFWSFFKKSQTDDEKHQKKVLKSLKVLEDKPEVKEKGGGFFSKLLATMLGGKLFRLGAAGGILGGLKLFGAKIFGGLAKSPLLRRVPILGSLLASLGGLLDVLDSERSGMSRADKDRATGRALGGIGGTLGGVWGGAKLGAAIGAAGGPIGAAIGSVVGSIAGAYFGDKAGKILGDRLGGFMQEVRAWDIQGKAARAWDALVAMGGESWAMVKEGAAQLWGDAKEVFAAIGKVGTAAFDVLAQGAQAVFGLVNDLRKKLGAWISDVTDSANEWFKQKTGVDVKAKASAGIDYVKDAAASAYEGAKEAAKKAGAWAYEQGMDAAKNHPMGKAAARVLDAGRAAWSKKDNQAALLQQLDAQGITDPKERAMFMAQMSHESAGFSRLEESFNYSSADRVMAVSATARKRGEGAVKAAMQQGPQALAELMYGGRKDLGNTQEGDAYAFRGRGFVQLTGRANYEAAGQALGLDLVGNPDLAADPAVAAQIATWFWKSKGISEAARAGDVDAVTKRINGGLNGAADRRSLYAAYVKDAGVTQVAQAAQPRMPVAAAAPAVTAPAPAPAVTAPVMLASSSGGASTKQLSPLVDQGQDISDRKIAHIATGGIGA